MKTKQQLIDETLEAYKKAIAPALEAYLKAKASAWEACKKRLKEIEAMK
jgi:hypothetical protein